MTWRRVRKYGQATRCVRRISVVSDGVADDHFDGDDGQESEDSAELIPTDQRGYDSPVSESGTDTSNPAGCRTPSFPTVFAFELCSGLGRRTPHGTDENAAHIASGAPNSASQDSASAERIVLLRLD